MSDNPEHDADVIEHNVRRTQDEIGRTVQKLEEQLTPRQVARSVVGGEQVDLFDEVVELAKRNPIPVALIAVGTIWLLSKAGPGSVERLTQRIDLRPAT